MPKIKMCAKRSLEACLGQRPVKSSADRKILILDLDNTLVDSVNCESPVIRSSLHYDFWITTNNAGPVHFVKKRPHLDYFLSKASKNYDIYIYSAADKNYVDAIVERIDPRKVIKNKFYRCHCKFEDGHAIKNVKIVCNDMRRVIMVDDNPYAFKKNKKNGILIKSYRMGTPVDNQLVTLLRMLKAIKSKPDIRIGIRKIARIYGFNQSQN